MKIVDLAFEILLKAKSRRGFTLIELLVVMTIIGILMALVIGIAGPVQQQARVYRTKGEIAAIETALTRFETDNGFVPPLVDIAVNGTNYNGDPANYVLASKAVFLAVTGKHHYYGTGANVGPNYYTSLKSGQVYNPNPNAGAETGTLSTDYNSYSNTGNLAGGDYLMDAWSNPYGYYYDAVNPTNHSLFNQVTYDLWSTSGETTTTGVEVKRWTTNWPNQ